MDSSLFQFDKLDSDNYDTWSMQVRSILVHSELWPIVNGKSKRPTNATEASKWDDLNEKALAIIVLLLKTPQINYVKNCTKASDAWNKLADIHKPSDPIQRVNLYKKLLSLRMPANSSIVEYLNDFTETSNKLAEMGLEINEELLVVILLSSLCNDYQNFVQTIESANSLPTFDVLKMKLLLESSSITLENDEEEGVDSIQQEEDNQHGNSVCNKKLKCFKCGTRGHIAKYCKCPSYAPLAASNNNALDKTTWCIDSGSNYHMCCNRQQFSTFVEHKEKIKLASNKYVEVMGKGEVTVKTGGCQIILDNVLYVPEIIVNVISVGNATQHGYKILFEKNEAIVMDSNGVGLLKARNQMDLYLFSEDAHESSNNSN